MRASPGGRYLADLWMYNLNKLAWTAPSPADAEAAQPSGQEGSPLLSVSGPPPAAGWSVTPLQDNKLLVMGGHTKAGKVCVLCVVTSTQLNSWDSLCPSVECGPGGVQPGAVEPLCLLCTAF